MGIYRILHIKALQRRKKFLLMGIQNYNEQVMKINKELERYEQELRND
jgi:hypothetical protein